MISGLGVDIVEVLRIRNCLLKSFGPRFSQRILHPDEQDDYAQARCPARFLAKRFAAKEAFSKAYGTGIGRYLGWQDLAVVHSNQGRPEWRYFGKLAHCMHTNYQRADLSLSDERHYVVAVVVLSHQD